MSMSAPQQWLGRLKFRWSHSVKLVSSLAGCLFAAQALAQQTLPADLQKSWRATRLPDSAISLVVQEVNGPRLMSLNASEPRNPASVMKMVTTWTALSGLGPDYTWRTAFYAKGGGQVDA